MHDNCPECGQKFDLEQGFWYGTGYVSYALAVAIIRRHFYCVDGVDRCFHGRQQDILLAGV